MGCDIHAIIEIRKNGIWQYIEDLPDIFLDRNYSLFSILNENVRNYCMRDGFPEKGLPPDISGKRFRFVSQKDSLTKAYNRKDVFCIDDDGNIVSMFDERMRTEIDAVLYETLKNIAAEKQGERYRIPVKDEKTQRYFVQDAQKIGAKFVEKKYSDVYETLDEFNCQHYHYQWSEEEQDFGYYEVDFTATGFLHSASYLTLTELLTKVTSPIHEKTFSINKEFLNELERQMGGLPETLTLIKETETDYEVAFMEDPYDTYVQIAYNSGIEEMSKIKEKYGIENDEDIRVVFAFDS